MSLNLPIGPSLRPSRLRTYHCDGAALEGGASAPLRSRWWTSQSPITLSNSSVSEVPQTWQVAPLGCGSRDCEVCRCEVRSICIEDSRGGGSGAAPNGGAPKGDAPKGDAPKGAAPPFGPPNGFGGAFPRNGLLSLIGGGALSDRSLAMCCCGGGPAPSDGAPASPFFTRRT